MKTLIDIPDEVYKRLFTMKPMDLADQVTIDMAIKHGIILDNLTNGEVIQKMFPDAEIVKKTKYDYVYWYVTIGHECGSSWEINDDWWNRKWGEA